MVSKRLDTWRRDISEKRRKRMSKRYYIPMKRFNSKPPEKVYFLHLFFRFSLNFPNVKISNCFTVSITGRRMFASTLGRARPFTPMNSSSAKIHESVARRLRQPIHGFGCVAHKRIYSQWLQRHMMPSVFFFELPQKEMPRQPDEPLWWDGFYSDSLKQTVDQLWEHCASWSYTRRGSKLILSGCSVLEAKTKT